MAKEVEALKQNNLLLQAEIAKLRTHLQTEVQQVKKQVKQLIQAPGNKKIKPSKGRKGNQRATYIVITTIGPQLAR